jgi:hypothetical protein
MNLVATSPLQLIGLPANKGTSVVILSVVEATSPTRVTSAATARFLDFAGNDNAAPVF